MQGPKGCLTKSAPRSSALRRAGEWNTATCTPLSQVTLHSDLVNVRIRLQNPLTACNQMPSGPDRALFITHSQSNPESSAMEALMAEV